MYTDSERLCTSHVRLCLYYKEKNELVLMSKGLFIPRIMTPITFAYISINTNEQYRSVYYKHDKQFYHLLL